MCQVHLLTEITLHYGGLDQVPAVVQRWYKLNILMK